MKKSLIVLFALVLAVADRRRRSSPDPRWNRRPRRPSRSGSCPALLIRSTYTMERGIKAKAKELGVNVVVGDYPTTWGPEAQLPNLRGPDGEGRHRPSAHRPDVDHGARRPPEEDLRQGNPRHHRGHLPRRRGLLQGERLQLPPRLHRHGQQAGRQAGGRAAGEADRGEGQGVRGATPTPTPPRSSTAAMASRKASRSSPTSSWSAWTTAWTTSRRPWS